MVIDEFIDSEDTIDFDFVDDVEIMIVLPIMNLQDKQTCCPTVPAGM